MKKLIFDSEGKVLPFRIVLILTLVYLFFASFYTVDKNENATKLVFGKYTETLTPGFHFVVPFISTVKKTDVTSIKRIEIGFRTTGKDKNGKLQYVAVKEEGLMLTGDDNIVFLDFVVQYATPNAYDWQFVTEEPLRLLGLLSQSCMRTIIGGSSFDKVATTDKIIIEEDVAKCIQEKVDLHKFGGIIKVAQLQEVSPPSNEVKNAFRDVISAREDKQKQIFEANQYANKIIPEAKGEASKIINDAKAYAYDRVQIATGEVSKFNEVYKEYRKNPLVTKNRLIFESQKQVLPKVKILVNPSKGNVFKHLDMSKFVTISNSK